CARYLISIIAVHQSFSSALPPRLSAVPIIVICLLIIRQFSLWLHRFLYIAGGLFILYLAYGAYKSWQNFDLTIPSKETGTQQNVLKAALINTLNPNPYIFWSLVTGPILLAGWHKTPVYGLAFVAGFYITMILSLMVIVLVFG